MAFFLLNKILYTSNNPCILFSAKNLYYFPKTKAKNEGLREKQRFEKSAVTSTSEPECRPLVANNIVQDHIQLKPEWQVDIDFRLLSINPDTITNILNLQRRGENGALVYADHGFKTPGRKF